MLDKDKIFLIIGANGLIGKAIAERINKICDWIGTYNKRAAAGLRQVDITSKSELDRIFLEVRPQYVVNCANLAGGVDFCESHPDCAAMFHFDAVKSIVKLCKKNNIMFIFISTDYIFDGTKGQYKEDDSPNPVNLYGKLKLKAEQLICNNLNKYLIIRTTNVFGWDPETVTPNYIMNLYRTVKNGNKFNAPSFLKGNPTYVYDIANAIIELCKKDAMGVFHVVGSSFINRFEWAVKACSILGLDCSLINEIKQPWPDMTPRPLYSSLNTEKFRKSYDTILHDVSNGLMLMRERLELNRMNYE